MTEPSAAEQAGATIEPTDPLDIKAAGTGIWWQVFEHAPDPTIIVDESGHIIHANVAAEEHPAGRPRDELNGRLFFDLVVLPARRDVSQVWKQVITQQAPLHIETELERRAGGAAFVKLSFTPLPRHELVVVTIHNLSQHAVLYQQEHQRASHMAVLSSISEVLSQTLELDRLLNVALGKSLEALGIEAGAITLVDPETKDLVFMAQHGWQHHDFVAEGVRIKAGTGLSGEVVRTDRVIITDDVTNDPRIVVPEFQAEGVKAMALAPMRARNRVVGVLSVMSYHPHRFSEQDQQLLAAVADRVGLALDNARLFTGVQRRLQEQSALHEIAVATQGVLSLQTVMQQGLRALLALFELDAAAILFVDKQNRLIPITSQGSATRYWQQLQKKPLQLKDTPAGRYAMENRSLIIQDLENFEESVHSELQASGLRTIADVPLLVGGRLIGVLEVGAQRSHALAHDDLPLLESLGTQLASAIEAARLYEQTERRVQNLTTLTQVSAALNRTLDLDAVLHIVLDEILTLVNYPSEQPKGAIFLIVPNQERLRLAAGRGLSDEVCSRYATLTLSANGDAEPSPPLPGTDFEQLIASSKIVELAPARSAPSEALFADDPLVAIPLRVEERPMGVILVAGQLAGDQVRRLLSALADMAAVSIDKAHLHQETQRRLREMTALFNFAQHLSTHLQMETLLQTIATSIREVLGCLGVSIALLDQDDQILEIKVAVGLEQEWREKSRLSISTGVMGQVAATGQAIYLSDVDEVEEFILSDRSFRSLLIVPLIFKNRVIGTLSIAHAQANAFNADDERLITIAAAQAAVAIENARLFNELQERATSLARAYDELKELDRMKDELVQNISHQLRTPLTFVRGYVDLLLRGDMGELTAKQSQSLEVVSAKTATVAQLVNNIMLLQELLQSGLQLALTNLVRVTQEAVAEAQDAADRQGVSLQLQTPSRLPLILADPERITLVFQQLLQNAIKFSPNGGLVLVRLEEQADHIEIAVSDQGIGITQDQLDRIFESFYQIDSSVRRRFEGTGLGLSIVKRILEAHGGRIWVKSRVGKGSVFFFSLPKSRHDQSQENNQPKAIDRHA